MLQLTVGLVKSHDRATGFKISVTSKLLKKLSILDRQVSTGDDDDDVAKWGYFSMLPVGYPVCCWSCYAVRLVMSGVELLIFTAQTLLAYATCRIATWSKFVYPRMFDVCDKVHLETHGP